MAGAKNELWLGVDSKNQIGCFFPGQSGPVPHVVEKLISLEQLRSLLPEDHSSEVRHTLLGRLEPNPEEIARHIPHASNEKLGRSVLFLKSLDPVLHLLSDKRATLIDARENKGVVVDMLLREDALAIHRDDQCLSCFWPRRWEEREDCLPRKGLFRYDHLCETWISGPYGSALQPFSPLKLDDFGPEIQGLCQVTFEDLEFGSSPRFQPAEHRPCRCVEHGYLDSHGEVRDPGEW
jgi:hypothetical protein